MCTATWWRPESDPAAYTFFFNRDELKSRAPGRPPREQVTGNGTSFLTPVDGERGGTWILVNECGLTLAILNHYTAGGKASLENAQSRGRIPLEFADTGSITDLKRGMDAFDPSPYRPFFLLGIDRSRGPWRWEWDGEQLQRREDVRLPITTSSFDSSRVIASRVSRFESLSQPLDSQQLESFHHHRDHEEGAVGVRMRRPDAQTVSFSRIDVSHDQVRFAYRPEKTDSDDLLPAQILTMPLRAAAAGTS